MNKPTAKLIATFIAAKVKRAKGVSKDNIISLCTLTSVMSASDKIRNSDSLSPKERNDIYKKAYIACQRNWKRKNLSNTVGFGFFVTVVNNFILLSNAENANENPDKYLPPPSILLMHEVRRRTRNMNLEAWKETTGMGNINTMTTEDWGKFYRAYRIAAKKDKGWLDMYLRTVEKRANA